jgi:lysozyme
MKHSKELLDFVCKEEGFRSKAYKPLPNDRWTVGHGLTYIFGRAVNETDKITEHASIHEVDRILDKIDNSLNKKQIPDNVTQQEYDAVVSLVYNIGFSEFIVSNTAKLFYEGYRINHKFPLWNKSNGEVVAGLINRRNKEKELYEKGTYV